MNQQVNINQFDRGKPFYPLIVHYVAQIAGFKELLLRGITESSKRSTLIAQLLGSPPLDVPSDNQAIAELSKGLKRLAGPLQLRSEYQNSNITIDIDQLASEVVDNHLYLVSSIMRAAGSLLVLAHELSKDAPWHTEEPLWEFLRHCRNAAAHGGRFHFTNTEPKPTAEWGTFEITRSLQNTLLFRDASGNGMLSPGDPIRLMWDIEQTYPAMKA